MPKCDNCGERGSSLKTCGACKMAFYCSSACQKAKWKQHKLVCQARKCAVIGIVQDQEIEYASPTYLISGTVEDVAGNKQAFKYEYPISAKELQIYRTNPMMGSAFVNDKLPSMERDLIPLQPWKCGKFKTGINCNCQRKVEWMVFGGNVTFSAKKGPTNHIHTVLTFNLPSCQVHRAFNTRMMEGVEDELRKTSSFGPSS